MPSQPNLPPQALPEPDSKTAGSRPRPVEPEQAYGRSADDWSVRLKRCPFDGREKRIKWLGVVEGLPPVAASKVLQLVGDPAAVPIAEFIELVFGREGEISGQLLTAILEIAMQSGEHALLKDAEAVTINGPSGRVMIRRAGPGVVLGITLQPGAPAMRWMHLASVAALNASVQTQIRGALAVSAG